MLKNLLFRSIRLRRSGGTLSGRLMGVARRRRGAKSPGRATRDFAWKFALTPAGAGAAQELAGLRVP